MEPGAAEMGWGRHAGAWLAIGTSPGAIVLGAQLAERRAGPLPLLSLALGGGLMVVLLLLQGQLGLQEPRGHGQPFSVLSRSYLRGSSRRAVGLAITGGMVGWVGFSIGIGGESLARLAGLPHAGGALCLGAVVLVLILAGVQRWNAVALFTTVATLVLAPLLLLSIDDVAVPVTPSGTGVRDGVGELAAFVGYVAVFMLRAPDFTWGSPAGRGCCAACSCSSSPPCCSCLSAQRCGCRSGTPPGAPRWPACRCCASAACPSGTCSSCWPFSRPP